LVNMLLVLIWLYTNFVLLKKYRFQYKSMRTGLTLLTSYFSFWQQMLQSDWSSLLKSVLIWRRPVSYSRHPIIHSTRLAQWHCQGLFRILSFTEQMVQRGMNNLREEPRWKLMIRCGLLFVPELEIAIHPRIFCAQASHLSKDCNIWFVADWSALNECPSLNVCQMLKDRCPFPNEFDRFPRRKENPWKTLLLSIYLSYALQRGQRYH
jgi:hypothetical protein